VKLDQIKAAILAQQAKNQKSGNDLNALAQGLGFTAKYGPDFVKWLSGGGGDGFSTEDAGYNSDEEQNAIDQITSDRRLKESIVTVKPADIDGFLRAQGKTQTWEYKPGRGLPPGRKLGPMAQDMKADKLASMAVGEDDDGMMSLDYQALAALALAGLGRLNQRVETLEERPGKSKSNSKSKADVAGYLAAQRKGRR
jgi:hypothetical protein